MANRSEENEKYALEIRQAFAKNFREARLRARYSQEDMAERSNLSQSFISDVETGESDASLANSCLMARAVGQPLCKLIDLQED